MCLESITVSSTTATEPVYHVDNSSAGDNATGYVTTGTWKHDSDTLYMEFSAESTSVFWFNQSETQADLNSNSVWLFKMTKQ